MLGPLPGFGWLKRRQAPDTSPGHRGGTPGLRFLLWIDGVGGYLVCLANTVTMGQATPETDADVPLQADISRQHATLTRDSEGYLLNALRTVLVNGKPVDRALLKSGDQVTLGSSCRFQFQQPVPVSTSARLDLVSGHRPPLGVDAVLLMADTLVLGPGEQAHVPMPDLKQAVILFRHKSGLAIRAGTRLTINGQTADNGRGLLERGAKVDGDDFALKLE